MTVSRIQVLKITHTNAATATSAVHALASTAPAGSRIIFGGFIDKSTQASAPAGWTTHIAQPNTNLSYFLFSKIADGTELNLTVNFGDSTSNTCKMFSYVLSGDAAVDVVSHVYSTSTVRSITSNTTAALGANPALVIAAFGADSTAGITAGTGHTVDNDYALVEQNYTDSSPGGVPALAIAEKTSLFDTGGEFATFSYTGGTTDEMGAMIIVIRDTNPPVSAFAVSASSQCGVQGSAAIVAGFGIGAIGSSGVNSSAQLVQWSSVTIADPIDFSVGSIFHEDNWQFGTPVAGQKVYFDPRNGFSIDSHGQMSADVNTGVWACQYDDGTGVQRFDVAFFAWATSSQSGVQGSASIASGATGALSSSSQVGLQGAAQVSARPRFSATSQAGVLSTAQLNEIATGGVEFSAAAQAGVQGSAQIATQARFSAASQNILQGTARLRSQSGSTPPIGSRYNIGVGLGLDIGPSFSEAA